MNVGCAVHGAVRWVRYDCALPMIPPTDSVAVAGFINPHEDWELIAGTPEDTGTVSGETLAALDKLLAEAVARREGGVLSAAAVRQCEEMVIASKERKRQDALVYWQQVGACLDTQYLVVPYIDPVANPRRRRIWRQSTGQRDDGSFFGACAQRGECGVFI